MSTVTVNNTSRTLTVASAGTQGPIGIKWRAAWAPNTAYAMRDAVQHDGSSYRCIEAHTSSSASEPGSGVDSQTCWMLLAARGGQGARGPEGPQGPQGPQGESGPKGAAGGTYESYGIFIYKADGVAPGGYYADRSAGVASVQARLYAEIIDGDPGSEVDLYLEIGGAVAYGPLTVVHGAPVFLSGLTNPVAEGDEIGFVLTAITGAVRDLFIKSYGAVSW